MADAISSVSSAIAAVLAQSVPTSAGSAAALAFQPIGLPVNPADFQSSSMQAASATDALADVTAKVVDGQYVPMLISATGLFDLLLCGVAGATAAYAEAEAQASTNPAQAAVWPVTSKALQVAVQNAWNDWRSAGADEVENALDTPGSVGGAIGAHLVSEARDLLKVWDLGLTGAVPGVHLFRPGHDRVLGHQHLGRHRYAGNGRHRHHTAVRMTIRY